MSPPIERRKLRTVAAECGTRASSRFLANLGEQLARAGLYTEPPLAGTPLRPDDWVLFSTGPFPPDSLLFAREKYLQRFVEACLGTGVFRNLRPFREGRHVRCREYRLPDGNRIDLLCEEVVRSGVRPLVAIELKRERQRGTVEQMIGYMDALRDLFPERAVKGIVVSGREDQVAASLLTGVSGYDISWYCYHVSFDRVAHS
jgi:hypothetical protein